MSKEILSIFHPLVARWFSGAYGRPTPVQARAWRAVADGGHVLLTAPTGSGKTLAAFLWALDRLITGQWSAECTRVLYVSPLKALNNDIRRNLLAPLLALRALFEQNGLAFPRIEAATRSGDTSPAERRRMLRQPPQIQITTPESLNLLLTSAGGRACLTGLKSVILDEVHAILGSRRGTFLITAVERLTRLSGEFQRIALSATVRPLETAARFVGGYRLQGAAGAPRYTARPVAVVADDSGKAYALQVRQPAERAGQDAAEDFWAAYAESIRAHVQTNQATLVFTNSRQLCEKLTLLLNRGQEELVAYSHHGSLSREIRATVEGRLKAGALKAIVATGSLELGIDIGTLDEVILVQSPVSAAEAAQRVGRAGHGVGQTSRATFYPSHPMDIVTAAVLVQAVAGGEIEAVVPMAAPLDVLAQVMISMCAFETWEPTALYDFVRTAEPYHDLSRRRFDLVLELLEGRYQQARLRELQPRLRHDRVEQRLSVQKGAVLTLYTSGGVIPDRGYYSLRHAESGARIGELDEEFVWEARVGQVFTLGAQNWRIQKITPEQVQVLPAARGKPAPPFWKAEENGRSFYLAEKIGCFMEAAEAELEQPSFDRRLREVHGLDEPALTRLKDFLRRQRVQTGCALPHRHHLVIEYTTLGPGGAAGRQVVWHTLWGGRVNRPLAVALEAAWEEAFGHGIRIFAANDGLSFVLPRELAPETLIGLVRAERLKALLQRRLAATGFFGARFRECAGRALLLPRGRFNQRMPLWLSRLRAQKLLAAVAQWQDFPILVETWRTCLQDAFDLPALEHLLRELEQGRIAWTAVRTSFPSPMARNIAWQPINTAMYQDDQGASPHAGGLMDDLLFEVTLDPNLRPQIDPELAATFEAKRQRLAEGYSPDSPEELLEWVKERVALPQAEWQALMAAMARDHGPAAQGFVDQAADKLVCLQPAASSGTPDGVLILAREVLPRWLAVFHGDAPGLVSHTLLSGRLLPEPVLAGPQADDDEASQPLDVLVVAEWLRFYGPRPIDAIARALGIPQARLDSLLEVLAADRVVVSGALLKQRDGRQVCDRENFEHLLRLARRQAAPAFEALETRWLPLFLAAFQGLTRPAGGSDDLAGCLEQLLAWPAPAGLWESDLLPARLGGYRPEWLDRLVQEGELRWLGASGGRVMFCYENELDLIAADAPAAEAENGRPAPAGLFPDPLGRYPFSVLARSSGLDAAELHRRLWAGVWQGELSNDAFGALRWGIDTRFKPEPAGAADFGRSARSRTGRRPGRGAFQRRHAARIGIGNWFQVPYPDLSDDPLDREERNKERVRLLLDRYGIIFRELASHELPLLQWRALFRALRLMELSGEVVSGQFFQGIAGLQFISPRALELLRGELPRDAVYWLNALDPASLCGLGLEAFRDLLPKRLPGCHLVYHGNTLAVVSRQLGRHLQVYVPANHERLQDYLAFLKHLLTRAVRPLRTVRIETINAAPAERQTAYLAVLARMFEVAPDPKGVNLYPRHHPPADSQP